MMAGALFSTASFDRPSAGLRPALPGSTTHESASSAKSVDAFPPAVLETRTLLIDPGSTLDEIPEMERLLGPRADQQGIFVHGAIEQLVRQHETGARDHSAVLWALLMLDASLTRLGVS